jgi:hypothetical protein
MNEIGLWGPKVQKAYADMGVIGFGDVDVQALSEHDEQVGQEFDRRVRDVKQVAARAE